jgi:hypothetical protein
MAETVDKYVLQMTADNTQAVNGIRQVSKETQGFGKKAGSAFKLLKSQWLAVTAATAGMVLGFRKLLKSASDFAEANAKFRTVFKGVEKQAGVMRTSLVKSFGLSQTAATQFLASTQDLFVPLGIARDKAAELSGTTVKLARDMASFNNLDTGKVLADIQSALVGNFETTKKYGVVINDTIIKQEAMQRGLKLTNGQLSAQDKAMVALDLIMKGSTDAMGDYARTQDSFANTTKRLGSALSDIAVALGGMLIRAIGPIVSGVTKIATKFSDWVGRSRNMDDVTNELIKTQTEYNDVLKKLADTQVKLSKAEESSLITRKAQLELDLAKRYKEWGRAYEEYTAVGREGKSFWESEQQENLRRAASATKGYEILTKALKEQTGDRVKFTAEEITLLDRIGVMFLSTSQKREAVNKALVKIDEKRASANLKAVQGEERIKTAIEEASVAVLSGVLTIEKLRAVNENFANEIEKNLPEAVKRASEAVKNTPLPVLPPPEITPPDDSTWREDIQTEQQANVFRLANEKLFYDAKGLIADSARTQEELNRAVGLQNFTDDLLTKEKINKDSVTRSIDLFKWQMDEEARLKKEGEESKAEMIRWGVSQTQDILGQLSAVMDQENKTQFKIHKAASASNAGISALTGAVGAFSQASATYPPPFGQIIGGIAAAAIGALGVANVSKILGTPFGGSPGAFSGGSIPSGSPPTTADTTPLPTTVIRGSEGMAGPTIEINAKVVDEMAVKALSKDILRITEEWQARGEAY